MSFNLNQGKKFAAALKESKPKLNEQDSNVQDSTEENSNYIKLKVYGYNSSSNYLNDAILNGKLWWRNSLAYIDNLKATSEIISWSGFYVSCFFTLYIKKINYQYSIAFENFIMIIIWEIYKVQDTLKHHSKSLELLLKKSRLRYYKIKDKELFEKNSMLVQRFEACD